MILLELVPYELQALELEMSWVKQTFSHVISGFNIPDILRIPIRSLDTASLIQKGHDITPHIRAMDHDVAHHLELVKDFINQGGKQVLVVQGDAHVTSQRQQTTSLLLIKALKVAVPGLKVFAAIDPYRTSFEEEIRYAEQKMSAGADGFFTQPFFDLELAAQYLKALSSTQLFLGSSPVLTEASKRYWETVNHVKFHKEFSTEFKDNMVLAKSLMALSSQYQQHLYLMPIKLELKTYLNALF